MLQSLFLEENAVVLEKKRLCVPMDPGLSLLERIPVWIEALKNSNEACNGQWACFLPDDWVRASEIEVLKGKHQKASLMLQAYALWEHGAQNDGFKWAFWPKQECLHSYKGVAAFLEHTHADALAQAFKALGMRLVWLGPRCLEASSPTLSGWPPSRQNLLQSTAQKPECGVRSRVFLKKAVFFSLSFFALGLFWGNRSAAQTFKQQRLFLKNTQQLQTQIGALEKERTQLEASLAAVRQQQQQQAQLPRLCRALEVALQFFQRVYVHALDWDLQTQQLLVSGYSWASQTPKADLDAGVLAFSNFFGHALGVPLSVHTQSKPDGSLYFAIKGSLILPAPPL